MGFPENILYFCSDPKTPGMFNMVLFGPPGAGKGTQSRFIAGRYGFIHLSTGQILRDSIRHGRGNGRLILKYMERGFLVPDNIVLKELLKVSLHHQDAPGLIFDGFPRTVHQAQMLDELLSRKGMPIGLVISLEVEQEELYRRIIGRAVDSGRVDDHEEVVRQRFMTYKSETLPLKEFYQRDHRLVEVSGMAPKATVFERICHHIEQHLQRKERQEQDGFRNK